MERDRRKRLDAPCGEVQDKEGRRPAPEPRRHGDHRGRAAHCGSPFVFSHDGERPIRLDGVKMKPHLDRLAGVTDWRIHDLRRTARTLLARARVPYDIAEMALGHALKGGIIRATYDHHEYLDEKAEAFDKLAGEIDRIVSGYPGGKVIQLRS